MLMKIYFVDDNQESINEFKRRIENLDWIDYLFKSGIRKISNSAGTASEQYVIQTEINSKIDLSDDELNNLWYSVSLSMGMYYSINIET
jgi:hypothetical protein